jgi:hypothetical protein
MQLRQGVPHMPHRVELRCSITGSLLVRLVRS